MKRTFQPSVLVKKRKHGFLIRNSKNKLVLQRRIGIKRKLLVR